MEFGLSGTIQLASRYWSQTLTRRILIHTVVLPINDHAAAVTTCGYFNWKRKAMNSIMLSSSLAGLRAGRRPASELDIIMEFGLSSAIQLTSRRWSQTWFPTCRRQVRAISTCRDSSNLVTDWFVSWFATC